MQSLWYLPIFIPKQFLMTSFRSSQILKNNLNHNVSGHSYLILFFSFNLTELGKFHLGNKLHKVSGFFIFHCSTRTECQQCCSHYQELALTILFTEHLYSIYCSYRTVWARTATKAILIGKKIDSGDWAFAGLTDWTILSS